MHYLRDSLFEAGVALANGGYDPETTEVSVVLPRVKFEALRDLLRHGTFGERGSPFITEFHCFAPGGFTIKVTCK